MFLEAWKDDRGILQSPGRPSADTEDSHNEATETGKEATANHRQQQLSVRRGSCQSEDASSNHEKEDGSEDNYIDDKADDNDDDDDDDDTDDDTDDDNDDDNSRGQPLRKSGLSCHLCDKLFGHRLFGLISHYALYHFRQALRDQHADGDTKMRVCRVCGLELSSGQGLVNHLAVRHDLVRPLLPPHVWERIENFRSGGGGEGDDS